MQRHITVIIASVSLILCVLSCGKSHPVPVKANQGQIVVEWDHGLTLKSAEYRLNGELIGRGSKAFEVLMAKLKDLPNNRIILFRVPYDIASAIKELDGDFECLPLRHDSSEKAKFDQLFAQKQLSFEVEMYDPIEFLSPEATNWLSSK
ncbi:hypothetical protein [Brevifollis gellanilyticus]|uniref:Uncharacterized protein n=1 Tax=Brevifollis gellanilyticus TaxID=748831 RepID=A0A512M8P8_9BACT|nr:hypothetical protein [Brevifollis gellanilyticus]GEP43095.1 hypothetical protein BGE01nite_23860 [Brevifollis gellanilyticus]